MADVGLIRLPNAEVGDLRAQLREAQGALEVIRSGEVDALGVGGPLGQHVYTITNADRPYRLLIEQMKDGAVTLSHTGLIVYCNEAFASLLGRRPARSAELIFNNSS